MSSTVLKRYSTPIQTLPRMSFVMYHDREKIIVGISDNGSGIGLHMRKFISEDSACFTLILDYKQ